MFKETFTYSFNYVIIVDFCRNLVFNGNTIQNNRILLSTGNEYRTICTSFIRSQALSKGKFERLTGQGLPVEEGAAVAPWGVVGTAVVGVPPPRTIPGTTVSSPNPDTGKVTEKERHFFMFISQDL